jgi:hypothetical protein
MPRSSLKLEASTSDFYAKIAATQKIDNAILTKNITARCEKLLEELTKKLPNINFTDVVKSHNGIKELQNLEICLRNMLYCLNK